MGTQQYGGVAQVLQVGVVDGDQSKPAEAVHLRRVVYDVAQTAQLTGARKFGFRFLYGSDHTEAEAGIGIYLYRRGSRLFFVVHQSFTME